MFIKIYTLIFAVLFNTTKIFDMFRAIKRTKVSKSVKEFMTIQEAIQWLSDFCKTEEKDCYSVSTKERWGMVIFRGVYLGNSTINVKYFQ